MTRVVIIGPPGSGKSTLARQAGAIVGVAPVYLDTLFWRPGWVRAPREEFLAQHAEAIAAERWVTEGVYRTGMDDRLAAADTIIFLNLPRRVCLWRVIRRRWLGRRGSSRPDMAPGCPEKLDGEFLRYVWHWWRNNRPELVEKLDTLTREQELLILSSRSAVAAFLRRRAMSA